MDVTTACDRRLGSIVDGSYRLDRVIGQGAMGVVYEASHLRLPRRVAVKFLHPVVAHRADLNERFRREARIVSTMRHASLVEVYDLNQDAGGVPYMILELLEGEELAGRLRRVGRLSLAETASLLFQVSGAVELAHAGGVIHRDLKPSNVFFARQGAGEVVKLLDFGVSKLIGSRSIVTMAGSVVGTANYMAPEQAVGADVDQRADVFSLAAILYECLTGRQAFPGATLYETYQRLVHGGPPPLDASIPAPVAAVLYRALDRDPERRPAGAMALRDELLFACRAAAGTRPDHPVVAAPHRTWRTWLTGRARR